MSHWSSSCSQLADASSPVGKERASMRSGETYTGEQERILGIIATE
jgi:hypothetical protein